MAKNPSAVFRLCTQCELVHAEHTTCPGCGSSLTVADETYFLGKPFGKYQMESILGVGGMGVVYQAVHTTLNRKAAVKFVLPQMTDEQFLQRFLREIQVLAELKHPNIVEIYDYDVSNWGPPYYVMEYLEGKTLRSVLNHHTQGLPLEVAAPLIQNMCSALGHAHRRGVVHRDLKPENIFIARFDHQSAAKILDFGIAKVLSKDHEATNITSTGIVMGTPHYLAPEQVLGKNMGPHTDQYALALILAEIFTGTAIRAGKTVGEIVTQEVHKGLNDEFLNSSTIPDSIKNTLKKAVEVKPEDRFPDMQAFLDSLGLTRNTHGTDLFAGPAQEDANAPTTPTPLSGSRAGVDVRDLAGGDMPTMDTPLNQHISDATAQMNQGGQELTTPTPIPKPKDGKKLTGKLAAELSSLETAMTPAPKSVTSPDDSPPTEQIEAPKEDPAAPQPAEEPPAPKPPVAAAAKMAPEPEPEPPAAVEPEPEPEPAPPAPEPEPAPPPPPEPEPEPEPAPPKKMAPDPAAAPPPPPPEKKKKKEKKKPAPVKHDTGKQKKTKLKPKAIHAAKDHLTPSGTPRPAAVSTEPDKPGKSKTGLILALVAVVVLAIAGVLLVPKFMGGQNGDQVAENTEGVTENGESTQDGEGLPADGEGTEPADSEPAESDPVDPEPEPDKPADKPADKPVEPVKGDKPDPEAEEAKRFMASTRTAQTDMDKARKAIAKASTPDVKKFAPDLLDEAKNSLQGASTGFKRAKTSRDMDQVSAAARESISQADYARKEATRLKTAWEKTEAAKLAEEAKDPPVQDKEPVQQVQKDPPPKDPEPVKQDPPPGPAKPKHGELVEVHLLDMPIQPTKKIRVKYTATARQAQVKGRVTIKAKVGPDGKVIDAKLVKALTKDLGMNDRALEAVKRTPFEKPTSQGVPVTVWTYYTLVLQPPAQGFAPKN